MTIPSAKVDALIILLELRLASIEKNNCEISVNGSSNTRLTPELAHRAAEAIEDLLNDDCANENRHARIVDHLRKTVRMAS